MSSAQASLYGDSPQDSVQLRQMEIQRGRQIVYAAIEERKRLKRGGEPMHVEVVAACACSSYPFPHVHGDEEKLRFIKRRGTWWRAQ